jgi:hypothetical protein
MARHTARAPHLDLTSDMCSTLWTLRRDDRTTRCALFSRGDAWEVRVLVDGEPAMSRRCARWEQALTLAAKWAARLAAQTWRSDRPAAGHRPAPAPEAALMHASTEA